MDEIDQLNRANNFLNDLFSLVDGWATAHTNDNDRNILIEVYRMLEVWYYESDE